MDEREQLRKVRHRLAVLRHAEEVSGEVGHLDVLRRAHAIPLPRAVTGDTGRECPGTVVQASVGWRPEDEERGVDAPRSRPRDRSR